MTCKHPPKALYSGWYWSPVTRKDELWVACKACGEVLKPTEVEKEAELKMCEGLK